MVGKVAWQGVFPAVTTQFKPDLSLDVAAMMQRLEESRYWLELPSIQLPLR